jgi:transcriptional regulator with XRE-family HTH domain
VSRPDVKKVFGRRVRTLRLRLGWSQEHLAGVVGLDRSYVGGVERGERNVSLENIAKLADALMLPLNELMDLSAEEARAAD